MVDRLYEAALEARPAENPLSDPATKNKLIRSLYGQQGFAKQHIDSYDEFVNFRISEIILSKMNRRVLSDSVPSFWLEYTGIRVAMPTFEKNYDNYSRVSALYPHEARTSDLSYSADIFVDVRYSVTGAAVETRRNVKIGRMPVMVGSSRCHLRGRNERELAQLQECPYDPRGYFIINGTEKVLLIQEQMIENRILVERHPKLDSVVASVVSYTIDTKTMCELQAKNGRMYVRCGSFSELVPVFVLFKAFGMECDQEVFQLVNCTDQLEEYLVLSLEDCHKHGVFTTEDAVEYLSKKLWKKNFESKRESRPKEEVRQKLANILLVHVPVAGENLLAKAQYLALMMKKLIEGINDPAKIDNRDYYGNKRMKCAGTLLELLFEDRFKVFNNELREELNKFLLKHKDQRVHELSHLMESRCGIITHGLHSAIATGNWNIKRFHIERKGVSQQLSRISFISAIGMITRLNSQFEKTRKIAGPRALLGSHWGMICPCDTPDGEGCGLVKNLALTTCITTSCRAFKYKNLGIIEGNLSLGQGHRVILDGIVVGYTFNARLVDRIRLLRRRGLVEKFVNVAMIKGKDEQFGEIMINTDSGRLVRPLLILERGRILLTKEMVRELDEDRLSFDDLVGRGVIEFLDVNEEDNALIAVTAGEITVNHTHLEIDPFTIIGVVAGIIPYPHHNQSPRNLFQCSMGKQAQGIIGLNELVRNDTLNYLLSYPQQPLVKTAHIELINYNRLPAGQNASVAVMSYSGYDIEDAIIVNRAALDRGFERSFYYRRYENELKKHGDYGLKDTLVGKEQELKASERKNLSGFFLKKYGCLDEDGLAKVGRNIQGGEVYVNKKVPVVADAAEKSLSKLQESIRWNDEPSTFKSHSQNNYVDRVILTSNDQNTVVKTITREMRRPELGDKLSSRHGQKGVCGLIVPEEDMPFSETGWRPDLIMNPHGYPSRMTVGKLMELIGGKAGCLKGRLHSGTAFAGDRAEDLCRVLTDHGFSYTGKDTLISGTTGEYLSCYVFSGPIFYQRLKHMVADKIHARSTGKVTVLTRQPTEGRSKEGGLRLGEMERDCLLGFGASDLLLERLLFSSDDSTVLVCELCGFFQHGKRCESCRKASAYRVKMPYACKLLFQELISMGIRPKINLGKIDDNPFKEDPPKQAKAK